MRISTALMYDRALQNMQQQQVDLNKTQNQLSTGRKLLTPADDPGVAARVTDLNDAIARIDQHGENAGYATQRLQLEESTLNSVEGVLQSARELALRAGNLATLSPDTRAAYTTELSERINELLDYANTRDANGDYLFSGFQSRTQPFTQAADGAISYNGDHGQMSVQISASRRVAVSDSGAKVFEMEASYTVENGGSNQGGGVLVIEGVNNPANYKEQNFTIVFNETPLPAGSTFNVLDDEGETILADQVFVDGGTISVNGMDVTINHGARPAPAAGDSFTVTSRAPDMFTMLNGLLDDLQNLPDTTEGHAELAKNIEGSLRDIDRAIGSVSDAHVSIGGRMKSIESQNDQNEAKKLHLQTVRSDLEDLDYAEAITRMNLHMTVLQAAQQSFVKVQSLSLFEFI